MESRNVIFNGKFLSAVPTGVHRVAGEIVRGIDGLLLSGSETDSGRRWTLACPRDAKQPLPLARIDRHQVGRLTWQAWEQLELPLHVQNDVLVGLCNMAPLAIRGAITLIHDAHVFTTPQSSSSAFNAWYRFALPIIGARSARIVTVSEYSRQQLIRYNIARADRICVIHNGADHLLRVSPDRSVLDILGIKPHQYVLAVGSTHRHKNIGVLFRALEQAELQGLKLVIVGPDGVTEFMAKGDRPPNSVVFAGYRSDSELRSLYEHAACLAFPSTTEGFGLPPVEAMTLGCPVLVAPCGALPEICGSAAIYIDPHDPLLWARAARTLALGGIERDRLVEAGLVRAKQFRWLEVAKRWLGLIGEVASASPVH